MRDEIVRAMTADGLVKAVAINGRDLVERARNIHTLLPVATAALGRSLMAASMMGDMLKIDGASLTLQIKGGGLWAPCWPCLMTTATCGAMCRIPTWSSWRRPRASWTWARPWHRRQSHRYQGPGHEGALRGHHRPVLRGDRR